MSNSGETAPNTLPYPFIASTLGTHDIRSKMVHIWMVFNPREDGCIDFGQNLYILTVVHIHLLPCLLVHCHTIKPQGHSCVLSFPFQSQDPRHIIHLV